MGPENLPDDHHQLEDRPHDAVQRGRHHHQTFKRLLGTDELVLRLRELMPGGISKRTVYAWLDMGCPHVPVPGARKKLGFVFDEVVTWIMSHRVERDIYANHRRVL